MRRPSAEGTRDRRLSSLRPMAPTRQSQRTGANSIIWASRQSPNAFELHTISLASDKTGVEHCEMQTIHDNVTVCAVPPARCSQSKREPRHTKQTAEDSVMQYIVENTGLRVVSFRIDFSGSRNVVLVSMDDTSTGGLPTDTMAFECTVYPFERRVMIGVAKQATRERAMIRVTYELLAEFEPDVGEITQRLEQRATDLRELTTASDTAYAFAQPRSRLGASGSLSSSSWDPLAATDFCANVNQFFSLHGNVWVDSAFQKQPSTDGMDSQARTIDLKHSHAGSKSIPFSMCSWWPIHLLLDDEKLLCVFRGRSAKDSERSASNHPRGGAKHAGTSARTVSGLPGQQAFSCALAVVAADVDCWKRSWFPDLADALTGVDSLSYMKKNVTAIPVRLCEGGVQWTTVVIDLLMPVFPLGDGLLAPRSTDGELWPALLLKACAKLHGSYEAVANMSTVDILRELLGVPCVNLHDPARSCQASSELAFQRRLERIFSCTRRSRGQRPCSQPVLLTTFDAETSLPNGAGFTILSYTRSTLNQSAFVVLGGVDGMLDKTLGDSRRSTSDEDATEMRSSVEMAVAWHDFIRLRPRVLTLLPSVKHTRRIRRRFLRKNHRDGIYPGAVVMAISIASLSTVVLAGHLRVAGSSVRSAQCQRHERVPARLEVRLCSANALNGSKIAGCGASTAVCTVEGIDSGQGRVSVQTVQTLAPGEYIVAVRVVDWESESENSGSECICSPADTQERDGGEVLSPTTTEANLAQLFQSLDREIQGVLTASDLSALVYQHGDGGVAANEVAAIEEQVIDRFGSFVIAWDSDDKANAQVAKRAIRLDDLRDVYRLLAANEGDAAQGSAHEYQEFVWHDLVSLLGQGEADTADVMHVDAIAELVCCVSSDSPLVDCVQLPVSTLTGIWSG